MDFELKRNDYYKGKLIDVDDLKLEQRYFIDKIKAINSALVGYGIVDGLKIQGVKNSEKKITVNKGIGIDSHGNFIVLPEDREFELPEKLQENDHIYLKYKERGEDRLPAANEDTCSDECVFDHIVEDLEIHISNTHLVPSVDDIACESKGALPGWLRLPKFRRLGFFKRRSEQSIDLPILYIGKYIKVGDKGSISQEERSYLHTNAEIAKLLCRINQSYVRSVNGKSGDLSLVSSINGAAPDESGDIVLIAGNNVEISEEDHKIKISMQSGYHAERHFHLKAADTVVEIEHNRGVFPVVDIYKRVKYDGDDGVSAVMRKELEKEAKAFNMETEEFLKAAEAEPYKKRYSVTTHDKNKTVHTMLKKANITDMSYSVMKRYDAKINYHLEDLFVVPKYSYEKIVGKENFTIKVTHVDRNTVKVENQGSTPGYYMAVLNA